MACRTCSSARRCKVHINYFVQLQQFLKDLALGVVPDVNAQNWNPLGCHMIDREYLKKFLSQPF